ncbi:L-rhamnose mutarotase [Celeribacter baekdonensis]|uniref:L-rhamnose mutarotase n=1 Tax=Celeribacter baekdonensis TaxID=875171 RepID=A0A2R4LXW1_9RHOB|nr:L-rhamnose mutarotase [Celeribacter baekdonensis]AVW89723.1 L-rhamnose mutarotase [Celeribacter baekdonensis]
MEKYAFRMVLNEGQLDEYKKRHDEIWPELCDGLKAAGVSDYSIHYDPQTCHLFAVLWRRDDHIMDTLPDHPVVKKWWAYMADIMETNADNSPVETPLQTVFHMS